jgi:PKD repeat protein
MPSVEMLIGRTGQSRITNPTWNSAKPIYNAKVLPMFTYVTFSYDNCEIKGKIEEKTTWILKNNSDPSFSDIYLNSKYFTYMFDKPGNYTLQLSIQDNNQNKYTREKNILVIK